MKEATVSLRQLDNADPIHDRTFCLKSKVVEKVVPPGTRPHPEATLATRPTGGATTTGTPEAKADMAGAHPLHHHHTAIQATEVAKAVDGMGKGDDSTTVPL